VRASAVVVNWNGKNLLRSCLTSLGHQSHSDLEILVVDNGSTDGSREMVRQEFPKVILIENEANLGFAKPNNQGMARATGEVFFLINNDAEADPECVAKLVAVLEQDSKVGMVASKIIAHGAGKGIDSVGGLFIYPDGMSRGRGRGEEDLGQYDSLKEILMPSACACIYRRAMIEEVGDFDEDFYAYCEDTDLGLRGRLAGWKSVSMPEAVVRHGYSRTAGRYSPLKAFLVERNHIWVIVKDFPTGWLFLSGFYACWRYLLQAFAALARKGSGGEFVKERSSGELLGILLKAWWAAFLGMPRMFQKRATVQAKRKVGAGEVRQWFRDYRLKASELVFKP
jgi:GT2 family glycosyltransferase